MLWRGILALLVLCGVFFGAHLWWAFVLATRGHANGWQVLTVVAGLVLLVFLAFAAVGWLFSSLAFKIEPSGEFAPRDHWWGRFVAKQTQGTKGWCTTSLLVGFFTFAFCFLGSLVTGVLTMLSFGAYYAVVEGVRMNSEDWIVVGYGMLVALGIMVAVVVAIYLYAQVHKAIKGSWLCPVRKQT